MFKPPRPFRAPVKFVYCPACGHVSMLSRFERETCEECRKPARIVRVAYPWQSLLGMGIVLAGCVFLLAGQAATVAWSGLTATLAQRLVWFVLFIGGGLYFSMWGARIMRKVAHERGRAEFGEATT
jgi:hypothetical protein